MISPAHDIREFIHAMEDKDYLDMIDLADEETTEVERRLYHPKTSLEAKREGSEEYANQLKSFLSFVRYSVKPRPDSEESDYQLFRSVLTPEEV